MREPQYPLYHEELEHESCGVGAVADLNGRSTHRTVDQALSIVERLAHRAGSDALGTTGDGVGILTELPHSLFSAWALEEGIQLGRPGEYGVGMFFLPEDEVGAENACRIFEQLSSAEQIAVLGWRNVPCHPAQLGAGARSTMPRIRQCFLRCPADTKSRQDFDRRLYVLRRVFEKQDTDTYVCSLSCRTVVYKGMMLVNQLRSFYDDLQDARYTSRMAMVHSRFSTNTFPSWSKAHPHRMLLHNGEINTIRGNHDRMKAREETMRSAVMGKEMHRVLPVVEEGGSDSQMLDNTLEFLSMNGIPLSLAGMILIPEPWQGEARNSAAGGHRPPSPWRDLYRYYATMMEPWDGPAAVLYSDGEKVCASLDRNGLRPLRCALTDDHRLILSSEAGVLFEENAHIIRRWKLTSGDVLEADLETGKLSGSSEIKSRYAQAYPYTEWMKNLIRLEDLPETPEKPEEISEDRLTELAKAFHYTWEDVQDILRPMAENGTEPIVSMGADEPLAALSKTHPSLFDYFRQRFAQVTNPPIDALREEIKTDCSVYIGDDGNLLSHDPENCTVLELPGPILTDGEFRRIRELKHPAFAVRTVSLLYPETGSLRDALAALFAACDRACRDRINVLILSDRGMDAEHLAIPSLLAVSALEQHLIRIKKRTAVSVVLESGEPRDVHQLALLAAFGARAVNPYLAHAWVRALCENGSVKADPAEALANYDRALTAGVLKIASKMGVSTLQAYQSAQLFEAVGLDRSFVEKYFTNTPCVLGGTDLSRTEADSRYHHGEAFGAAERKGLPAVGIHRLRTGPGAEQHLYSPETIHLLQQAVWTDSRELFDQYAGQIDKNGPKTIRSMLDFRFDACREIPLSEVEPAESIVKRFRTGAMR